MACWFFLHRALLWAISRLFGTRRAGMMPPQGSRGAQEPPASNWAMAARLPGVFIWSRVYSRGKRIANPAARAGCWGNSRVMGLVLAGSKSTCFIRRVEICSSLCKLYRHPTGILNPGAYAYPFRPLLSTALPAINCFRSETSKLYKPPGFRVILCRGNHGKAISCHQPNDD